MASVAAGQRAIGQRSVAPRGWSPDEGWGTIVLHVALIVVMTNAIVGVDRPGRIGVLLPMAVAGALLGLALAKLPVVDLLAHLSAIVLGVMWSLLTSAVRYQELSRDWRATLSQLETRVDRLVVAFVEGRPLEEDLLVAVVGVTIWLVGYSSAWMLYRRGWIGPAVLVPGVVILTSLGLDQSAPSAPVFAYLLLAAVLAARHFAFRRLRDWHRARIPVPSGLPTRFLTTAALTAAAAIAAGATLPVQAPDQVLNAATDRAEAVWREIERHWSQLAPRNGVGDRPGTYSEFPDSFRIGGPIDLGDDPVAVLQASRPHYLAARRYDHYDGREWSSRVDDTFRLPGEGKSVRATRVTFRPMQPVNLSDDVLRARVLEEGVLTVVRDMGGLMLTIETHASTTEPTSAILGWRQLRDVTFTIDRYDPRVPVDLYALVSKLDEATLVPSPTGGEPVVTDPVLAAEIERLRETLRRQYPLETRLSLVNGEKVLTVSGRLPIYDDIEAIFSDERDQPRSQYLIAGLASAATPAELRAAGGAYPDYVTARYLQLPDSVTAATRELAREIVARAGANNPFDQAVALQDYLRRTYPYILDSDLPPGGRDFVDYFLFDKRAGRCEDFATAMVVMARTLGIPARLVAGYSQGDYDPLHRGYLYRENQAHTWVEVFFPNYGWIPFEPTPSQDAFNYGPVALAEQPEPLVTPTPEPTPTPTLSPPAEATPSPVAGPVTPDWPDSSLYDRTLGRLPWLATAVSLATLVGVVTLVGWWLWGFHGLRPGAAYYARALRVGRFWGVRHDPTMTPAEFAARFSQTVPLSRTAIRVVTDLYAAEQYGGQRVTPSAAAAGRAAWKQLRASIFRWRPWRRGTR